MEDQGLIEDWLEIGTIVSPQGLKGELKVLSSSDFPERFEQPGSRCLQSPKGLNKQVVELLEGRYIPGKNLCVIRLAGIESREQAEELRGYKLLVSASDRPQLEEDEYHVSDLVNLEVYHQLTREKIGTVIDILRAGNDLLEVQLYQQPQDISTEAISPDFQIENQPKTKKLATILIPFVKDIVPIVDLEGRRLEINPPPGLLELAQ